MLNKYRPQERFKNIYCYENDDDKQIRCDACLSKTADDPLDKIVICETCNVGIHQSCYGRELLDGVPTGEWNCERCTNLLKYKDKSVSIIKCKLCFDLTGIIVKVTRFDDAAMKKTVANNELYHITCVNHHLKISFNEPWSAQRKKHIIDTTRVVGSVNNFQFTLTCYICKKKGNGLESACLTCEGMGCKNYFHVRCGIKQGIVYQWEILDQIRHKTLQNLYHLYCKKHVNLQASYILPNEDSSCSEGSHVFQYIEKSFQATPQKKFPLSEKNRTENSSPSTAFSMFPRSAPPVPQLSQGVTSTSKRQSKLNAKISTKKSDKPNQQGNHLITNFYQPHQQQPKSKQAEYQAALEQQIKLEEALPSSVPQQQKPPIRNAARKQTSKEIPFAPIAS